MITTPLINIKAILFDLDGTLLDSFPVHYEVYEVMFERLGIQINKEKFLSTYSPDWYKTYEAMELPREKWELANSYWLEEAEKHSPSLFTDVHNVLEILSKKFAVGLVTSGSRTRVMNDLQRTGIKHLFKTIVTGDDIKNPKPSPEGLNLALNNLKLKANEAMYIGDTSIDHEMAKAGRVFFIGVNSEFRSLNTNHPEYSIHSITELPELLGIEHS
ncbi:MAG: HAD family hydrolase [bacterium]|nr:HAD family hydrolase [bacterium]